MIPLFHRLRAFADSLTGQLVVILSTGIASASFVSLFLAERAHQHDFSRVELELVVTSTSDIATRFARDPEQTARLVADDHILGATQAKTEWRMNAPDPELGRLLTARLGEAARPQAMPIPQQQCFPNFDPNLRAAGITDSSLPDCWFIRFRDAHGIERNLTIYVGRLHWPSRSPLDPLYMTLIILASVVLSIMVARVTSLPLRRLTRAARAFSVTADPEPIQVGGPREVRVALETFNLMQQRVREGFRQRTQILAAVTHDLQTPLTRLRLRLEQVPDEALRQRLIDDLGAMQHLVSDGLELARSNDSREPVSLVDIDSLLSSLAEDAADVGHDVRFSKGCDVRAMVKPEAFTRCLNNLIDNAVKYAGSAELQSGVEGEELVIRVLDEGPGIPHDLIGEAFQPYRRLGNGSGKPPGTGIGLTIADAQARTFGAKVCLRNRPHGGLCAEIRMALPD